MPSPLALTLGAVLAAYGVVLLAVAVLGARGALPRNRFVGVRTTATVATTHAFATANKVAAPLVGAAGATALAAGAVLLTRPPAALGWVLLAVAVVAALVLCGVGGVLGDRAARLLDDATPACAGSCPGCDLVAGCRPAAG